MKANFVARKFNITEDVKDAFLKKFKRFDRFFPEDTEITATVKEEGNKVKVELTIVDKGYFYRAEESAADPVSAVDLCMDIIEGQIRKYKTKLEKRLRAGAFDGVQDDFDDEESEINIAHVKKFLYKPMSAEEAILQMNMLGHQFYVFKDEDTDAVCVVYKRNKEGEYGLIEPVE
ncbi:MAG: ribosome-associated translation inhibitor RaiA [Ruminococcaceae bacterium]|nr:ribosome-associated translation inhibitor RaiA [Oscillospiraceae bacterium]